MKSLFEITVWIVAALEPATSPMRMEPAPLLVNVFLVLAAAVSVGSPILITLVELAPAMMLTPKPSTLLKR